MAFDGPSWSVPGLVAGANLSGAGNQYRFVQVSAAQAVTRESNAGARSVGVLYNNPAEGEAADVRFAGVVQVEAGAQVAAGANIATDNVGRAVAASSNVVLGKAITAAGEAGEYVTIVLGAGAGDTLT